MASRRPRRGAAGRRPKPAQAPGRRSYYLLLGISVLVLVSLIVSTCATPAGAPGTL